MYLHTHIYTDVQTSHSLSLSLSLDKFFLLKIDLIINMCI